MYSRLLNLYSKYDKLKSCEEYVDQDDLNRALGYAAIAEKKYEVAVEHLEKAIMANDGGIYQCQQLGYAYFYLKKYDEAAKAFKLGIRKHDITGDNGYGVNCYLEAGCAHYNEGKYDEALEWLKKGVKYYNNDTFIARYHYLQGLCYEKMGDNEEYVQKRREEYSKAVEYRYHWKPLYNDLAKDYARIGEKERAVEILKIGLDVIGPSGDYQGNEIENIYYDLFVIYADYHKDYNKAIEYLELMKNKTKYEYFKKDYWYRLGLVYNIMGEKKKMQEAFLKALELKHIYVDIYEKLHFMYMDLKDYYNAYIAGLNMVKHTEKKTVQSDGYKLAATAALMMEKTDISCELYKKAIDILNEIGEEIPYAITLNNLIAMYNERKPEAKDVFLSLTEDNIRKNVGYVMDAFRAEYMAKGYIDKDLAWSYHDELVYLTMQSGDKAIYEALVGISALLGDDKKQEIYTQKLFEYIDTWDDGCDDTYAWCYICKGDFEKAFEIYDKNAKYKSIITATNGYAEYNFVREKLGMEPYRNTFKPVIDEHHIDVFAQMYNNAADLYYDQKEYEKAIDILNHCLDFVGEIGDFSDGKNVYYELMKNYQGVDLDKMYELSFKLIEKTNNINFRFKGYKWRATLATYKYHRHQEAYDNYSIAYKMLPEVNFGMEDWELRNYLLSVILIMREHYIANEWVDKEFAAENLERFQQNIGKLDNDFLYSALFEISTALGEEHLIVEYEKLVREHLENLDDGYDYFAWHHIYLGDYEKAYELYIKNEDVDSLKKDDSTYLEIEFIKSKLLAKGELK